MSQIYCHPSGGCLFQVGASEIPATMKKNNIALVIYAAKDYQPTSSNPSIIKVLAPMEDREDLSSLGIIYTLKTVEAASTVAAKFLSSGKNVISSCMAGLNRSGIISAYTISKLTGDDKQKIVKMIRANRHPHALSNSLFVKLFLSS